MKAGARTEPAPDALTWKRQHHQLLNARIDALPPGDPRQKVCLGSRAALHAVLGVLLHHCSGTKRVPDGRLACWPSMSRTDGNLAAWIGLSTRHVRTLVSTLAALHVIEVRQGPPFGKKAQHDGWIRLKDGSVERTGKSNHFIFPIPLTEAVGSTSSVRPAGTAKEHRIPELPSPQRKEFASMVGQDGLTRYLAWLSRTWATRAPDTTDVFKYHKLRLAEWQAVEQGEKVRIAEEAEERRTRQHIEERRQKIAQFQRPRTNRQDATAS